MAVTLAVGCAYLHCKHRLVPTMLEAAYGKSELLRFKSLGACITTCFGENSPFKNRHADYNSSFLISWWVKIPSVNMRALCLLKAWSNTLGLPEKCERAFFFVHMHRVETLYTASCTVWRDLTSSQKNQMLFLILTPSSYMTLDSLLHLVTQYLFSFLKHWEIRSKQYWNDAVSCNLTINFKQYLSLITLYNSVH